MRDDEFPQMMAYSTSANTINVNDLVLDSGTFGPLSSVPWSGTSCEPTFERRVHYGDVILQTQTQPKQKPMATKRRLVKVYICDPDENVPLEKAILYKGESHLTDLTDQELFFEVPIKELLDKHNDMRVNLLDKEASKRTDKDVPLERIRVRDLKMVVVTEAEF